MKCPKCDRHTLSNFGTAAIVDACPEQDVFEVSCSRCGWTGLHARIDGIEQVVVSDPDGAEQIRCPNCTAVQRERDGALTSRCMVHACPLCEHTWRDEG